MMQQRHRTGATRQAHVIRMVRHTVVIGTAVRVRAATLLAGHSKIAPQAMALNQLDTEYIALYLTR